MNSDRIHSLFITLTFLFLAIGLQVQMSVFETASSEGIRIGLADFFLPLAGVFVLASLLLKKSSWPHWQAPFSYVWLVALSLVMTYALLHGRMATGEWSSWALINKYAGWCVLLAYLGLGAWLARNATCTDIKKFIFYFICCFLLVSAITAGLMIVRGYCTTQDFECGHIPNHFQLKGLMDNRNAYGLLLNTMAVMIILFSWRNDSFLPRWLAPVFWIMAPTLVLLDGSRILWLTLPVLMAFFLFVDWKKTLRIIVPCVLVGTLLFVGLAAPKQKDMVMKRLNIITQPYKHPEAAPLPPEHGALNGTMKDRGDNVRLYTYKTALQVWQQDKIFGGGLGSVMRAQDLNHEVPYVVDNTALWIIAEMGAVGLFFFTACFVCILLALQAKLQQSGFQNNLALSVCLIALTFAAFSLVHEMMYTRFLWFFLGLALVIPKTRQAGQD